MRGGIKKVSDDKIVNFIRGYMRDNGWSPSVREIGNGVGLDSSSTVHNRLLKLNDQGLIVYKGMRQIMVVG